MLASPDSTYKLDSVGLFPLNYPANSLTTSGNVSCTDSVGHYHVSTTLRRHVIRYPNNEEIKGWPYSDLVALTNEDAVITAESPEEGGKVFKFNFIDTPGLDDSSGNDMEIMANIVGRVSELDYLNAVIYVRNMNKPFGNSFKIFFDYLQRSMPTLCNGLIIVHSAFTIEKDEEFLSQQKDLAKIRKEGFIEATKANLDLSHFFMDNNPDETSPFANLQSFNECFRLLMLLSTQRPLPTSGLRLLKTPSMHNVDFHVLYALQRLQNQLKTKWTSEVALINESKANALKNRREIQRLNTKLEICKSDLEEIDNSSNISLGTKTLSEDYGIFKTLLSKWQLCLQERTLQFDASVQISHVHKSATGGTKWQSEALGETSWSAVLTTGIFQNMNATATFYTTNRLKYRREIQQLRDRIADLKQAKEFHEDTVAGIEGRSLSTSAVKLGEEVEKCGGLIERVERETFEMILWPLLKRFYVLPQAPTRDQIYEFVKVYEPDVAALLF